MTPADLKQARRTLGLTQTQIATVTGYGGVWRWSELERGIRKPSDSVVRLVQAYLDGYRPDDWPEQPENSGNSLKKGGNTR